MQCTPNTGYLSKRGGSLLKTQTSLSTPLSLHVGRTCSILWVSVAVGEHLSDVSEVFTHGHGHPQDAPTKRSRHPLLEESPKKYFGEDTTSAHLKMADVPREDTTRLIAHSGDGGVLGPFPLVAVRNVFVLPGVTPLRAAWQGGKQCAAVTRQDIKGCWQQYPAAAAIAAAVVRTPAAARTAVQQ